ncbi:MAG TPA: hypothetical protein VIK14_00220, partial [Ignavibacteria bacterium]
LSDDDLFKAEFLFTGDSVFSSKDLTFFNETARILPYINAEVLRIFQYMKIRKASSSKLNNNNNLGDFGNNIYSDYNFINNNFSSKSKIFSAFAMMWEINENPDNEVYSMKELLIEMDGCESNNLKEFINSMKKLSGTEEIWIPYGDTDIFMKIEKGLYTNPELLINYYIKNILKIALLQLNTSFDSFLNHLLLFAEKCANLNKQSLTILKIKLNDFKGLLNIID